MDQETKSLGIIAGRGAYPLELAESARESGVERVVAVAFKGETRREIDELYDEVAWMHVGQLTPFVDAFRRFGVSEAVMAGQIKPSNLFMTRFDKAMRELLASLPRKNADTIFSAIGEELSQVGVELGHAGKFMESRMPEAGVLTAREPTEQEREDVRQGAELAKLVAHYKAGQSVAIKTGTVIAVEGFEGTDKMIRRAGKIGGGGSVVVKVAQPSHDMRFDIPVVGLRTIQSMKKAKATALAIEEGKCILLERTKLLAEANRAGISILVMREDEIINILRESQHR